MLRELEAAGWFPGRKVAVDAAVPRDHPAHAVLREYGGLQLKWHADCGQYEIVFELVPGTPSVTAWAGHLRTPLVGIADVTWGHDALFLGGDGRAFGIDHVEGNCVYYADDFLTALRMLLRDIRPRPVFAPGQTAYSWYGDTLYPDDPRAYRY